MITVLSVGPRPGEEGGTASVVDELAATPPAPSTGVSVVIVDSGSRGRNWAGRALRFGRCLVRVGLGPADLVHLHVATHGSTWRKMIVAGVCSLRRRPYGIHLHAGRYLEFYRSCPMPVRWLIRKWFAQATYVVVLARHWIPLVSAQLGVRAERIHVVPNGVAAPVVAAAPPTPAGDRVVLFLGRIERAKGVPELLAAWRMVTDPRARLLVVGEATEPDVGDLLAAAAADPSSRVEHRTTVGREMALSLVAAAWVVVLPSRAEAFPMVPLEAMSLGVPCVVSRVGGVPEMIRDDVDGCLVEPGDVTALARRLQELIESDNLRQRLGNAAHDTWRRSFQATLMVQRLAAVWTSALSSD